MYTYMNLHVLYFQTLMISVKPLVLNGIQVTIKVSQLIYTLLRGNNLYTTNNKCLQCLLKMMYTVF